MKQLTMKVIFALAKELQKSGMTMEEIYNVPIYIGNDDELNGIHTAWYGNILDPKNPEDADFITLINEDHHNFEIKSKAILIS